MYLKSLKALATITVCSCLFSCNNNNSKNDTSITSADSTLTKTGSTDLKPTGPKPAWGKDLTDPMAVVIEKLVSFNAPPIPTLSAEEARKQPTPADAVKDVMAEHNIAMPAPQCDTTGKEIAVDGGMIHLRIYTPRTGKPNYPVIVYYHGGGWVIADLDTYGASTQQLCEQTEAIVVSVAYRQAPEYKFPTAHNDSYAAYEWTVKNAASIKGDPNKIALVGESAGGNLAAAVSLMARDKKMQLPVFQVLVYPIAGYDFTTPSYIESDSTKPLNNAMMKWFFEKYLRNTNDGKNPLIDLVHADLKGSPATSVIGAQYDPLRSEGEMLSDRFKAAGVTSNYHLFPGTTHEFFGMGTVVNEAKDAMGTAVKELKAAFGM